MLRFLILFFLWFFIFVNGWFVRLIFEDFRLLFLVISVLIFLFFESFNIWIRFYSFSVVFLFLLIRTAFGWTLVYALVDLLKVLSSSLGLKLISNVLNFGVILIWIRVFVTEGVFNLFDIGSGSILVAHIFAFYCVNLMIYKG